MRKLSLFGILVGGVADIVATNILSIPLMIYLFTRADLAHIAQNQTQVAWAAALHANPGVYAVSLLIGLTGSVFGGYVAAWIAKYDELLNGALSVWLCVAIGLYASAVGRVTVGPLEHLLPLVAGVAATLLGGYLRLVQNRAKKPLAVQV